MTLHGIRAAGAYVELTADVARLKRDLRLADLEFTQFQRRVNAQTVGMKIDPKGMYLLPAGLLSKEAMKISGRVAASLDASLQSALKPITTFRTRLNTAMKTLNGDIRKNIDSMASEFTKAGSMLFSGGLTAEIPIALSVARFAKFDDAMRTVKAVTGATSEQFSELTAQAKELGRTTSWTASQVADAMANLGRAGFTPSEIEFGIAPVMNLGRATGTDLDVSAELAGNAVRAFSLDASQFSRVADVMTATANGSAMTLLDLAEAFKYVAPIASAAGLSLEETGKILGALANYGLKGSIAGTSLKNILTRIADPKIQATYRSLGIELTDTYGRIRNVSEILRELGRVTASMAQDKRLALFKELFDMRGLAGGIKLTEASFHDLYAAIDNAAGVAERQAVEMDAGIGGAFRKLLSALEGMGLAIGDAIAPRLQELSLFITDLETRTAKWIGRNQEAILSWASLAAKVIVAGGALLAAGKILAGLSASIGLLNVAVKAYEAATIGATASTTGMTMATRGFAVAATVISSHPVIAALSALAIGASAVGAAFMAARRHAFDLHYELQDLADENEKLHKTDRKLFERLGQLAEKQNKTTEEIAEAVFIADRLSDSYDGLGLSVNNVTGEILGLGDAFTKFNDIVREQEKADISASIVEMENNVEAMKAEWASFFNDTLLSPSVSGEDARKQMKGVGGDMHRAAYENQYYYDEAGDRYWYVGEKGKRRLAEIKKSIPATERQINARRKRLEYLDTGINTDDVVRQAETGGVGPGGGGPLPVPNETAPTESAPGTESGGFERQEEEYKRRTNPAIVTKLAEIDAFYQQFETAVKAELETETAKQNGADPEKINRLWGYLESIAESRESERNAALDEFYERDMKAVNEFIDEAEEVNKTLKEIKREQIDKKERAALENLGRILANRFSLEEDSPELKKWFFDQSEKIKESAKSQRAAIDKEASPEEKKAVEESGVKTSKTGGTHESDERFESLIAGLEEKKDAIQNEIDNLSADDPDYAGKKEKLQTKLSNVTDRIDSAKYLHASGKDWIIELNEERAGIEEGIEQADADFQTAKENHDGRGMREARARKRSLSRRAKGFKRYSDHVYKVHEDDGAIERLLRQRSEIEGEINEALRFGGSEDSASVRALRRKLAGVDEDIQSKTDKRDRTARRLGVDLNGDGGATPYGADADFDLDAFGSDLRGAFADLTPIINREFNAKGTFSGEEVASISSVTVQTDIARRQEKHLSTIKDILNDIKENTEVDNRMV